MLLRNGQLAVKVKSVHEQQHFRQDIAFILLHLADVFPDPGKNGQIGNGLQLLVLGVSVDQTTYILALVWPAQGREIDFPPRETAFAGLLTVDIGLGIRIQCVNVQGNAASGPMGRNRDLTLVPGGADLAEPPVLPG